MKWPDDYINKVICGDCLEVMKGIPDGAVDALITDPPYGIGISPKFFRRKNRPEGNVYSPVIGDDLPFNPIPLLARFNNLKEIYLFGADNFCQQLPRGGSWLVWDKKVEGLEEAIGSDFELCWSKTPHKRIIHRILWSGFTAKEKDQPRQHPTQKPLALMKAIVQKSTCPDDIILDPFAGSGTTLVAAKQLGRKYIGIEIDPKYCEIARERLRQEELSL